MYGLVTRYGPQSVASASGWRELLISYDANFWHCFNTRRCFRTFARHHLRRLGLLLRIQRRNFYIRSFVRWLIRIFLCWFVEFLARCTANDVLHWYIYSFIIFILCCIYLYNIISSPIRFNHCWWWIFITYVMDDTVDVFIYLCSVHIIRVY